MYTHLFLLRTDPDVDHFAPLMWKCLEEGDRAVALFEAPYALEKDYRLKFLSKYPHFSVWQLWGTTSTRWVIKMGSRVIWNHYTLKHLLKKHKVSACYFEWGYGVEKDSAILRTLVYRFLRHLRWQLFVAARDLGIPRFCLPHGLPTKLVVAPSPYVESLMKANGGQLPFEDRNTFTVYVFNTEYHRLHDLKYARMSPDISQTWGSLRFSREWMGVVDKICPMPELPSKKESQIRVLFLVPKWHNRVDKNATLALLASLIGRHDVQVLLKTHPRKGEADLDPTLVRELLQRSNVGFVPDVPTPALISQADAVIDVGSSMALEVLLKRKHLIYPAYLHENTLIFDQYGGALIARSSDEVHSLIDQIVSGKLMPVADPEAEPVIQHGVYGGQKAFDVCSYYYSQIKRHLTPHPA